MHYRNCPECGKELEYGQKCSRDDAERKNRICISCSKKGKPSWNTGLTKDIDERVKKNGENIGKSLKGRIIPEETRKNMRVPKSFRTDEHKRKLSEINKGKGNPMYGRVGKKHPMWNPNLTDKDRLKRQIRPEWVNFRNECLREVDYTCELTGKNGTMAVHHLDGWAKFPEKRYDKKNIMVIKKELHEEFHNIYGKRNFTKEDFFEFAKQLENK